MFVQISNIFHQLLLIVRLKTILHYIKEDHFSKAAIVIRLN